MNMKEHMQLVKELQNPRPKTKIKKTTRKKK